MSPDLAGERENYDSTVLLEENAPNEPFALFETWLADAFAEKENGRLPEPTAMSLATVAVDGSGQAKPSVRIVLLKDFSREGFTFYTNYESRKAGELAGEPHAALAFHWAPLFRQVRVEGIVEKVDRADSEAYFAVRPRGSQLGAWASPQSRPVDSAQVLTSAYELTEEHWEGKDVPCPPHWGGFRVLPTAIEFWQGRPSRMHDRLRYELSGDRWQRTRLAP